MSPPGRVPYPDLRELLFADLPPADAATRFAKVDAIRSLAEAAGRRDGDGVRRGLDAVIALGSETRVRLQAWTLARAAAFAPSPDEARIARAVIVDMGLDAGTDTLAAYQDGTARYFNQSGATVIWEVPGDAAIGGAIRDLLEAGQAIADATEVLDGARPPTPGPGMAAIWVLTDGGIHSGIGPAGPLTEDALGGPLIAAAVTLMNLLVQRASTAPGPP